MNFVILTGRLGSDPELLERERGVKFSLAVKELNETLWVKILMFKNIPKLNKGSKVLVTGRLLESDKLKVVADRIEYI